MTSNFDFDTWTRSLFKHDERWFFPKGSKSIFTFYLSWVTNKFENIEIVGKIIAFQIKTYNPSLLLESEKLFMVGVFIFPKKPPISDSYFLHLIIQGLLEF